MFESYCSRLCLSVCVRAINTQIGESGESEFVQWGKNHKIVKVRKNQKTKSQKNWVKGRARCQPWKHGRRLMGQQPRGGSECV